MDDDTEIKLLVIDDDSVVRRNLVFFLEEHGFDVIDGENGRIGLELFRQEQPDMVMTDLHMPEMDGYKVLEVITQEHPETPIVVCSGTGAVHSAISGCRENQAASKKISLNMMARIKTRIRMPSPERFNRSGRITRRRYRA